MVQLVGDTALDFGEIDHHTIMVQFTCLAMDGYLPVMSMQLCAFAGVVQFEAVCPKDFNMFGNEKKKKK